MHVHDAALPPPTHKKGTRSKKETLPQIHVRQRGAGPQVRNASVPLLFPTLLPRRVIVVIIVPEVVPRGVERAEVRQVRQPLQARQAVVTVCCWCRVGG